MYDFLQGEMTTDLPSKQNVFSFVRFGPMGFLFVSFLKVKMANHRLTIISGKPVVELTS